MSSCHNKIKIVKLAILFYIVRPYVYIKKSYANEKDLERAKNLLKKIETEVSNFEKSNNIKYRRNVMKNKKTLKLLILLILSIIFNVFNIYVMNYNSDSVNYLLIHTLSRYMSPVPILFIGYLLCMILEPLIKEPLKKYLPLIFMFLTSIGIFYLVIRFF